MLDIKRIPIPALIGIVLTTLFVLAAIFAPFIAPHGNGEIIGDVWEPMSSAHWLGTDNLGRDLLSRMIYGARITLFIAVLATALSFSLGAILGFSAAVFGGWYDTLLSRLVDLLMSIPTLIMALVVLSVLPTNLVTLILVMGVLDSTLVYRLSRAVAADINIMDYVEAAKLRGEGSGWIIFREILPNALPMVIVQVALDASTAILIEAGLGFLGLSDPTVPSWGEMLNRGQEFLELAWWMSVFPGMAIAIAVLGFNLFADGVTEMFNPRASVVPPKLEG